MLLGVCAGEGEGCSAPPPGGAGALVSHWPEEPRDPAHARGSQEVSPPWTPEAAEDSLNSTGNTTTRIRRKNLLSVTPGLDEDRS